MNTPVWVVKEVEPRTDYTLLLTFANGERKVFDARPLLNKPVYAPLRDVNVFLRAQADGCSVSWNEDVDIAPEQEGGASFIQNAKSLCTVSGEALSGAFFVILPADTSSPCCRSAPGTGGRREFCAGGTSLRQCP